MKPGSLRIIRLALAVQFAGVLSVPALVAAAQSPRGMWMAEWLRPHSIDRTIGVLQLRESKLTFAEQIGQVDWQLDLSSVKRIVTINGGHSLLIVSATGDEYIVSIMDADLTLDSPTPVATTLDRALQLHGANSR